MALDIDAYRQQVAEAYRRARPAAKTYADAPGTLELGAFGDVPPPPPAQPWAPQPLTVQQSSADLLGAVPPVAPVAVPMVNDADAQAMAATRAEPPLVVPPRPAARDPMYEPYEPEPDLPGGKAAAGGTSAPGAVKPADVALAKPKPAATEGAPERQYDTAIVSPGRSVAIPAREQAMMDPRRIAQLEQDQQGILGAQRDLGATEAQAAEDAGVAADRKGAALGDQQAEMARAAKDHDDYLRAQEDKLRSLSEEVAKAKIVPWAPSFGESLRYHLAAAFQGFVAGMKGGPNLAIQQMNKKLDDEMNRQREAIERKKGKIGDMQGLLASAYRRFGNMDQAMAAAHGVALQQLDAEQQAYAARTGSQAAIDKSSLISRQMQLDADQKIASLYRYAPATTAMVGGISAADQRRIGEEAAKIRAQAEGNGKDISPEEARRQAAATLGFTTGSGYADISKTGKGDKLNQKDAESIRAHDAAIASIDELLALRAKHNGGTFDPTDTEVGKTLAARAQENLVAALGKTNQGLLDRTEHLIPNDPLAHRWAGIAGQDPIGAQLREGRKLLVAERQRYGDTPSAPEATPSVEVEPETGD